MQEDQGQKPSAHIGTGSHSNHVSQPVIQVSLGGAGVKALIGALIGVAVILLLTVPVAKGADQKADNTALNQTKFESRMERRQKDTETEVRMLAFWAERATIACRSNGVKMPPLPGLEK